jgi:hypothetical protein
MARLATAGVGAAVWLRRLRVIGWKVTVWLGGLNNDLELGCAIKTKAFEPEILEKLKRYRLKNFRLT